MAAAARPPCSSRSPRPAVFPVSHAWRPLAAVPAAAGTAAAAAASATASATVTARVVMRLLTVIPIGGGNGTGSHLASAANDTVKYSAKIFPIVTRETLFPTFLSCHGDPGRIQ